MWKTPWLDQIPRWWRITEQRSFQIQTDRMLVANQLDIVIIDEQRRTAAVTDVAMPDVVLDILTA